ncbi:MAG: bifunctional riboflavin kinase/FAD synthetase [Rhodobacteraceae bacterium]|nr:bifunctional riboflavin kinase/FAD synthetase [Paracoccaceae bacterium]
METFRSYSNVPHAARGSTSLIGNFDGIHRGHQSVIDTARAIAEENGTPLGVITFEPHPRHFFDPDGDSFRLMNPAARAMKLTALGVDILFELPFDRALATMTAKAFTADVLSHGLGLHHAVVGKDFRYGVRRAGTVQDLVMDCRAANIDVTIAPEFRDAGEKISSTAIRTALLNGEIETASRLLGGNHTIVGPVVDGEKRGRTLGFPTANLTLDGLLQPKPGVYASRVMLRNRADRHVRPGVASIGKKPTFGTHAPCLEVHIFDFDEDIYGQVLAVELVAFLRPEITFADADELVSHMHTDADEARELLTGQD